jgi:hypothetical protein
MPFEHICARAYLASNQISVSGPKGDTDIMLKISVTDKSLGRAEKIIRNAHGYGLKASR